MRVIYALAVVLVIGISGVQAQVFIEQEPNDSRTQANIVPITNFDATISGFANPDSDFFRVTVPSFEPGIRRHRFKDLLNPARKSYGVEGTATHEDGMLLYSFGGPQTFFLNVASTEGAVAEGYSLYYSQFSTEVVDAGIFQPGTLRFRETNSVQPPGGVLELHLFNADGSIVPGGVSRRLGFGGLDFDFSVNLQNGIYYAALGGPMASAHAGGTMPMLAPGLLTASTLSYDLDFVQGSGVQFLGSRTFTDVTGQRLNSENTVTFYRIEVVPEPSTLAAIGIGIGVLARRRGRKP